MQSKISHMLESPQCIVSLVKVQKQTKLISGDRNQDHLNFREGNSNTSECLCCIFVCWYYSFSQPGVRVVTRVCCLCENPSRRTLWICVFFCVSILQLKNKVKYFFDEGRELAEKLEPYCHQKTVRKVNIMVKILTFSKLP